MKRIFKVLGWVELVVPLVVVYSVYRIGFGKPLTINEFANRQTILFLVKNPELFTQVGIIDGTILDFHSGRLAAAGVEKREHDYATMARYIKEVEWFERSRLDQQEQLTYDIQLDSGRWRCRSNALIGSYQEACTQ